MIARHWEGAVPAERAEEYLALMRQVALRDYARTPGNVAAWCLHRADGGTVKIVMFTLWADMVSIRAFAGDDPTAAKYYDFDPDFLLEMPPQATLYEVMSQ